MDSTKGWPIDHAFPHYRKVLPPAAIHHGYLSNTEDPNEEHINERIHWSVIVKHQAQTAPLYAPPNLPADIPTGKIAGLTDQEGQLPERDT